jgi:raffinose/stachyose/melibiose transport system permease protein
MGNSGYHSLSEIIASKLFWFFFLLLALPLLWVLWVSLQPSGGNSNSHAFLSLHTFGLIIFKNYRGIRTSFAYSSLISLQAAMSAMVVALSAVYLVNDQTSSIKSRRKIIFGMISLFFLPAFTVYPGVEVLARFPFFRSAIIQLIVVNLVQALPITFFLLLALFASLPSSDLEQLLLETGSRVKAFWWGVVVMNAGGVAAVFTITFAAIWNDFYVTSFITMKDPAKPFSVILQMFNGQYSTDYASLEAGAIISLIFSFLEPITLVFFVWGLVILYQRGGSLIGRLHNKD